MYVLVAPTWNFTLQ